MGATEHLAHGSGEIFADTVAGQPSFGARSLGGTFVGGIWFGADDDDSLAANALGCIADAAAPGGVSGVDDDEIRHLHRDRRNKLGLVGDGADLPAPNVAFEQLDDESPQGGVGHLENDGRQAAAHSTRPRNFTHIHMIIQDEPAGIRMGY